MSQHFLRFTRIIIPGLIALSLALQGTAPAMAAVYDGCGLLCGLREASSIDGIVATTSITALILAVITFALDIILLVAVLAVIVAGVYLIVSNGDEAQKDKAKNIIYYVIAGIILILFSRVLVMIVNGIFT